MENQDKSSSFQEMLFHSGELSLDDHDKESSSDDSLSFLEDSSLKPSDGLNITKELAWKNYISAGLEVIEQPESILVKDNKYLIDEGVNSILDEVVGKIGMPYQLVDFQRLAINALGQMKNVVLLSPTGSGKMNVPLLATLVLREKLGISKGVAIITQPLSIIMQEKLRNDVCRAAVLSMSGEMQDDKLNADAHLSVDIEDLFNGVYPVIFCHPESLDTPRGQYILHKLHKLGLLILVCLDEFHQSGSSGNWESFR